MVGTKSNAIPIESNALVSAMALGFEQTSWAVTAQGQLCVLA